MLTNVLKFKYSYKFLKKQTERNVHYFFRLKTHGHYRKYNRTIQINNSKNLNNRNHIKFVIQIWDDLQGEI